MKRILMLATALTASHAISDEVWELARALNVLVSCNSNTKRHPTRRSAKHSGRFDDNTIKRKQPCQRV